MALSTHKYHEAHSVYRRLTNREKTLIEWFHGNTQSLLDNAFAVSMSQDTDVKVLSVGAGDGHVERPIFSCLRDSLGYSKMNATIVEPEASSIQRFQDLVAKEPLHGVNFDWRCQTFQKYDKSEEAMGDKFHIIACMGSLYYLGDLNEVLKNLYSRLEDGGILLLGVAQGGIGFGKLVQYLQTKLDNGACAERYSSWEVQDACKNLNMAVSQTYIIEAYLDISMCLDKPPDQLSQDALAMLDFITYREDFVRRAPPDLLGEVLRFLGSECTERGPAGEFLLDESTALLVIRREG
ncbi:histamine N-methyltransferase A-like isoform X1 [Patiria miniata]|uniref:Methyltransferase domain-containing protein n=2 Tax=Patiria miniata TaxID=46514 RepID=A0A914AUK4_PATMI|nr:histamine N-methyltransferase A-like isoform X1 [Patiria miniata]